MTDIDIEDTNEEDTEESIDTEPKPNRSPAMWKHCNTVYDAMLEESELRVVFGEQHTIWEGYFTKLFRRLHLTVPMYSTVTKELMGMGCIRQLRRGGGPAKSVWLMLKAPNLTDFNSVKAQSAITEKGNTKKRAFEIMQGQINDLNRRLQLVESAVLTTNDEELSA